jgi:hypothetical protein
MRLKTHHARTGVVYEYYFERQEAERFHFAASADNNRFRRITVEISRVLADQAAGREVTCVEHYALAKMALFRALDEAEGLANFPAPHRPAAAEIGEILAELDLL